MDWNQFRSRRFLKTGARNPGMSYMPHAGLLLDRACLDLHSRGVSGSSTATLRHWAASGPLPRFHFFSIARGGNPMMYVNLFWVWGHPGGLPY